MATKRSLPLLRRNVFTNGSSTYTLRDYPGLRRAHTSTQTPGPRLNAGNSAIKINPESSNTQSGPLGPSSYSASTVVSKTASAFRPPSQSPSRRQFSILSNLLASSQSLPLEPEPTEPSPSPSPPQKPSSDIPPGQSKSGPTSPGKANQLHERAFFNKDKTNRANNPNPNPELPSFNLSSLGLSKNIKILIYTLIAILATIETWVWCQAIRHWWQRRRMTPPEPEPETKD
ncbi:hypothetical protein V8F06_013294 [Rhypophila decipiens]